MKSEVKHINIFNPFSGEDEELICTIELHFINKTGSRLATITKIVAETGDDIIDWINEGYVEELERDYVVKYHG